MIKCHLGPPLSAWIMQVSSFSSVHINRFHCIAISKSSEFLIPVVIKFILFAFLFGSNYL